MSVENVEILLLHDFWDELVSDGQESEEDKGEDHLDVRPGSEAEHAENRQLEHLAHGEHVDFPLRDSGKENTWEARG